MKKNAILLSGLVLLFATGCSNGNTTETENASPATVTETGAGQSAVQDETSNPNIVQVAVGSKDHSTLVAAVKAAELVDALSNAGPFTVFAPTNAAFDKLPAGTVDGLLKPESIDDLTNILQYHVTVGVFKTESLSDGQVIGQVNGNDVTIGVKDGKVTVNGANIVASVPASN